MPPRYAYWTILIDNGPTAFRARDREELLPTLQQLRRTNPDVTMKWFARGRLWDSPEAERRRDRRPPAGEKRGRDWRPGGEHKDPRARFGKKGRRRQAAHRDRPRDRTPGDEGRPAPPSPDRSRTWTNHPQRDRTRSARSGSDRQWRSASGGRRRSAGARHGRNEQRSDSPGTRTEPDERRQNVPPPKRDQSPDAPPGPERIGRKPKPPVRG
jgi:hypothetical protein